MRKSTKNSTLYEGAPHLVTEWHPTANTPLTPRTIKIAYPKKVCWICNEGHEWKATVKDRMKGTGCPSCEKVKTGKKFDNGPKRSSAKKRDPQKTSLSNAFFSDFETDTHVDSLGRDFRKSPRYKMKATAVIEIPFSGYWFYADLKNFSAGGMGFETDACIDPGTKVNIKLDRQLLTSDKQKYDSIIRWCKVLEQDNTSFSTFGLGAKFI